MISFSPGAVTIDRTLTLLVFLFALIISVMIAPIGLDTHHDGLVFAAARRMLQGEVPYRDFFYQYNVATVLLQALALKIFDSTLLVLRYLTTASYAVIAACIYLISRRYAPPLQSVFFAVSWACLSPFFHHTLEGYHSWSSVYMMACIMAGLVVFPASTAEETHRFGRLAVSGALFAAAFWFKNIAVIQAAAVVVWMALRLLIHSGDDQRRIIGEIGVWMAGFAAVILVVLFYLFANGAATEWVRDVFLHNARFSVQNDPSIFDILKTFFPFDAAYGSRYFWIALPVILIVLQFSLSTSLRFKALFDSLGNDSARIFAVAMAGWVEYFPLPHPFHLQLFMAPGFCFLAAGICARPTLASMKVANVVSSSVIAMLMIFAVDAHARAWLVKTGNTGRWTFPAGTEVFGGISLQAKDANPVRDFVAVAQRLDRSPEVTSILQFSPDDQGLFFTKNGIRSKARYDWTWATAGADPTFVQRRAQAISERKSAIYADGVLGIPGYRVEAITDISTPLSNLPTILMPASGPLRFLSHDFVEDRRDMELRRNLTSVDRVNRERLLVVPLPLPHGFDLGKIESIAYALQRDDDVPTRLHKIMFTQYVEPSMKAFPEFAGLAAHYTPSPSGMVELANLNQKERFALARFFLFHGVLTPRMVGSSTIMRKPLTVIASRNGELRQVWPTASSEQALIGPARQRSTRLLPMADVELQEVYYLMVPGAADLPGSSGIVSAFVKVQLSDGSLIDRASRFIGSPERMQVD
jgi:hypothetical protein